MDSTNIRELIRDDINITVQMPSKLVLVKLNLKASLSKIRDKLEKNSEVKMNDTFSFAKMINNNSSTSESLLAVIAREDEEIIILENIIDVKNDKFLYLKSEPETKPDWRFFEDKLKLGYGSNVTLKKANSRAFTIVDCEMDKIVDGYENRTIQIDLEEDKTIKNDFLLIADIDIPNFAKLGVSIKNSNIKNSNVTTNLTYNIIEYNKMSLKFKLEPTTGFIEAVKGVIASKDPRKFKDIINDFGRFISKKVILGGRAYSIARENFEENFGEYVKNTDCQASNIKIEKKSSKSLSKSNSFKYQSFKLFGGKEVCSNNFNESDWVESLNGFKNWSCIKFEDPVNIFQLLSEDLRKQILLLVGKKILYTNTEYYTYYLFVPRMYHTFKLNIPENILEILQHKDAECSIFSTVIDEKGKDTFNCQVIWPPNENPKLIIHCIQKNFRKRECKLKIIWMIVGYDINFDFNHSDFNVKLKVLKNKFNVSNQQAITKELDLEYDSSILCFGIPRK
uniref:MACPF domain-containing protein n=1 Tax=Rhizophagus irregularis (strain DAOM 181602 / DAOM 197198 / MUCL 43194) TaxID=747089 RepID=U9SW67_RHIID